MLPRFVLEVEGDANAKDAKVDERGIEHFLPAFIDVGDVPLVGQLVVAQGIPEHILHQPDHTMMKQVKKEYTVTTSKATFFLLVCIIQLLQKTIHTHYFFRGVTFITSTWVNATYFLWYLLKRFFRGKSTSISTSNRYPRSSQNLAMKARVELLCIEQMFPLQILIANYMNFISIPYSFVPKGGFITTRSTVLLLSFRRATFALMKSKAPPSTFSYSWSLATYTYFSSSSTPKAQAAPMKTIPHISMPVPTPRSATSCSSIGSF